MVLIRRRPYPAPIVTRASTSLKSQLPYGDGYLSPRRNLSPITLSPESGSHESFSFSLSSPRRQTAGVLPPWAVKVIGGLILLSWMCASYWTYQARATLHDLELEHKLEFIHHDEALKTLKDAEASREATQQHVQQLQETQRVLQHEKRMSSEMEEAQGRSQQSNVVTDYMEQRQQSLQGKINSLRSYIQTTSRREVLEKYGDGPHRVMFTVAFTETGTTGKFVMEMAPLELMPHSVQVFLDMVSQKMWDNSVFWHHDGIDHVISAAAVLYKTGDSRHHHFAALGLGGVSFAEYSSDYPHKRYTVGFSGRGPQFYINTVDNTKIHGPGGQGHHELPDEADPCFAKVVEGLDVVEQMYRLSLKQSKEATRSRNWHDNELTHIVKAEILQKSAS